MNLDEIQQIFFQECEEGLATLEGCFAAIRGGADDPETINTVFRAVHSIKGGAGAFGHERLQAYTHSYETLLDLVRNGTLALSDDLVGTIIAAFDVLSDHIAAARDHEEPPADAAMLERLSAAATGGPAPVAEVAAPEPEPDPAPVAAAGDGFDDLFAMFDDESTAADEPPAWQVVVRPSASALDHGGEPLLLIRELVAMGATVMSVDTSALPMPAEVEPERSYFGWTLSVPGTNDEAAIRGVFDFLDGDVEVTRLVDEAAAQAAAAAAEAAAIDALLDGIVSAPVAEVVAAPPPAPAPTPVVEAPVAAPAPASAPNPAPVAAAKPAAAPIPPTQQTIRVELDRLDRLVNLVGELVITQAMLAQRLSENGCPPIDELTDLDHLTRELQESTMAIRAQPMKTVFSRVPRIIRELEQETGKRVRLDVEGEMTEVDKTVVERIGEPLTHLIRNAVDHGLESTDDRLAAGKGAEGVVRLSAAHQSGRIVITVADDGRGIDRVRVRAKAVERGIVSADAQLSDEDIDNLIFAPGFSTAATVSNISGRGVGMDVVRKNIQALGGRIGIQSRLGHGSSFSMSLPLTLAVLDGMIVTVGEQTFVVPLSHIVESVRPGQGCVKRMSNNAAVFDVRGTYLPVHRVADQLGIVGAATEPAEAVLLVVESDGGQGVLMVDTIQDQRQVVVKSLEANYQAIHGLAGATILGDGRVALILDVDALISRWRRDNVRRDLAA
ncbi:two-component system chemotaxis sensor kinase CheA [Sphingomonas jinjuensis]|uniref:Chemotaxis protein CheA n=1 Tax=Sphingomonas jinjuensis TaxID=535907 RepID=A0A840FFD1_9SPHN|nr:chemotaxis protein CheA [Sphingomonas jinjuensis]MBB4154347.1 two-component system chemotaxis sensor kinase CheA [Sphingomonas jinjuensis]